MLILARTEKETVVISDGVGRIKITVNRIGGNRVWLAFEADDAVKINRGEVQAKIDETIVGATDAT